LKEDVLTAAQILEWLRACDIMLTVDGLVGVLQNSLLSLWIMMKIAQYHNRTFSAITARQTIHCR